MPASPGDNLSCNVTELMADRLAYEAIVGGHVGWVETCECLLRLRARHAIRHEARYLGERKTALGKWPECLRNMRHSSGDSL